MKAVTAISFTVLYTVFSCFAVSGIAASICSDNTCRYAVFSYQERGGINTDNSKDNCNHKPEVTAHVIQKQVSNTDGSGDRYLLLSRLVFQKHITGNLRAFDTQELYSKAVAQTSCPLFIKHCVLLI